MTVLTSDPSVRDEDYVVLYTSGTLSPSLTEQTPKLQITLAELTSLQRRLGSNALLWLHEIVPLPIYAIIMGPFLNVLLLLSEMTGLWKNAHSIRDSVMCVSGLQASQLLELSHQL